MSYHLDTEFDRQGTHSFKWEFIIKDDQFTYGNHADKKHGKGFSFP